MPQKLPPFMFEILLSFVSLAKSLSLADSVAELQTTRQTIRRHVAALEKLRNEKLFNFRERRYELTTAGERALANSQAILNTTQNWMNKLGFSAGDLAKLTINSDGEIAFYAQQHQIHSLFSVAPPLLKHGLHAWCRAECKLEHEDFQLIRPYLVIHRKIGSDWICSEVGENSSYATWLGWKWAKSAVGSKIYSNPAISSTNRFITDAYENVATSGGLNYDHICTRFPHDKHTEHVPVNYQRLVAAILYPNGEPAIASLVARTNNIHIDELDPSALLLMPDSELMEFELT